MVFLYCSSSINFCRVVEVVLLFDEVMLLKDVWLFVRESTLGGSISHISPWEVAWVVEKEREFEEDSCSNYRFLCCA